MDSPASSAVFISYASQDAAAALRLCEALRATGIEVWFDQAELAGGDVWDRKIRGQLSSCALFVPVISAATQARREGYFRLEWKLAAQRTHMISERAAFLLPVVIDATRDAEADVPTEFRAVQWSRLSGGAPTPQFVERVKKLLRQDVGASLDDARAATAPDGRRQATPLPNRAAPVGRALRARLGLAAGLVVLLAVVAGVLLTRKDDPAARRSARPTSETSAPSPIASNPAPAAAPAAASVAVLAFANMSADKDTEYFSDGVSEEILNALANNPALRVAGRTSSFSFKGKNATHVEIGRALNVARVIEGSVRKAGTKVRITVQLINAADGYQLWSQTFDKEMTDIFAVQSEIATTVALKLAGGSATPAASVTVAAGAQTKNLEAYDAYLRGRAKQVAGGGAAPLQDFDEAVRLDPDYALAWARIVQTHFQIVGRIIEHKERVRSAAEAAVRLAPNLPEARLAMAMVRLRLDRDPDAARQELAEAERRRPDDAEVMAELASLEWQRGQWGPRLAALIVRSAELDPQNVTITRRNVAILTAIGRYADAAPIIERLRSQLPRSITARIQHARNEFAWTGDFARALAVLDSAQDNGPAPRIPQELGAIYAMKGDFATAVTEYERGNPRDTAHDGYLARGNAIESLIWIARLETRRGNVVRAAESYAQALAMVSQFAQDFPDVNSATKLALIHAGGGRKTAAMAVIESAMEFARSNRDEPGVARARISKADILTQFGEKDAAIAELRAVHGMGWGFGYLLRRELEWEPLRGEPKFQQLMKESEARADAQPRPKK